MRLKLGVGLEGLTPQMVLASVIVRDCYAKRDPICSCTITSANDSKHSDESLHYCKVGKYIDGLCRALDFRTHDYHGDVEKLAQDIRDALGSDFDVVVEDLNGLNEHIHVEYDPN